jgi:hypothetical protein
MFAWAGYDADCIRSLARQQDPLADIPSKCNRQVPVGVSACLCRARNLVERFSNNQTMSPNLSGNPGNTDLSQIS